MKARTLVPLTLFLLGFGDGYAQSPAEADSTAFILAVSHYHQALFPENGLYNGGEYLDYSSNLRNGHPYFGSPLPQEGWVCYDGMRYEHLRLWYDLVFDAVVLSLPQEGFKMQLLSQKVDSFSLSGLSFVRLVRDSAHDIRTDFYEVLYTGGVRLLRRSSKNVQENVTPQGVERNVYADSTYYLEKGGRFYSVGRKASLLDVLADRRKEVQSFMRAGKLSLKRSKDETLVKIIAYYDTLPR